jgi:hypothetical protein
VSEAYDAGTAAPDASYESPAEADGYGGYHETEADTQARIADQDQLPAPAKFHAVNWGDSPDYSDETDLAAEYDGDTSAFITGQDDLPTPQESHAANWGDDPDYHDETDLAAEYDGDLSALIPEGDSPAAQNDPASPDVEGTHADSVMPPEGRDAAATAGDASDQAGADLTTAEPGQESQAREAAGPSADADPGQADQAEMPERDAGDVLSANRLKALETENDAARQKIADLEAKLADQEAELKAVKEEQAARLDRIEQQLAGADRQPESTDPPEQGTDQSGLSQLADAALDERESTSQEADPKVAEATRGSRWRAVVAGENVQAAGTLVGAADTVAQFAMHATPEGVVGLGAMVLGVAGLGIAKYEQHRKERHDRPDQRQAREGAERSNN